MDWGGAFKIIEEMDVLGEGSKPLYWGELTKDWGK